jgi:hypothetical protein
MRHRNHRISSLFVLRQQPVNAALANNPSAKS